MAGAHALQHRELAELESEIASAAERALTLELACSTSSAAASWPRPTEIAATAAGSRACSTSPRAWPSSPRRRAIAAPRSTTSDAFADRRRAAPGASSRRWTREGQRFIANDCDCLGAASPLAPDRPEHGRQEHVPAPERADRDPRPGRQLRAGRARPGSASSIACSRGSGAADDLARGRSTFMVEMVETAAILHQASRAQPGHPRRDRPRHRDLDGLSIAWAVVEHLHEVNRCRGAVRDALSRADRARRQPARAGLPHDAGQGVAGRRGVPARGRRRAPPTALTASMSRGSPDCPSRAGARRGGSAASREGRGEAGALARLADDLPLFARGGRASRARAGAPRNLRRSSVRCARCDPDALTPREALQLVYRLKMLLNERATPPGA